MTTRIRVWDLSIRIFHWALTIWVVTALFIALTVDDHDPLFRAHMLAGLSAGFLLVVRVIISFIGGRYSRIRGLFFAPAETYGYLKSALAGKAKRYLGHNPGTAAVAIGMFIAVIILVCTGLTMNSRFLRHVHEYTAYAMMGLIGIHLLGILLHTIRHKEMISLSMITGKREGEDGTGLASAGVSAGLVVLLLIFLWLFGLSSSFDFETGKLRIPLTGQAITLGRERKVRREPGNEQRGPEGQQRESAGEQREPADRH